MKLYLLGLLFFITLPFFSQAQVSEAEYKALVAFYKSTNGDNWKNNTGWDITQNPKNNTVDTTWHGVTTDMKQRGKSKVTKLYFFGNNLRGKIPSEIGNLVHLDTLCLAISNFKTIPSEMKNLTNLKCLDLASNKLEYFPAQLFTLKKSDKFKFIQPSITL